MNLKKIKDRKKRMAAYAKLVKRRGQSGDRSGRPGHPGCGSVPEAVPLSDHERDRKISVTSLWEIFFVGPRHASPRRKRREAKQQAN